MIAKTMAKPEFGRWACLIGLASRVHAIVFTEIAGGIRVISFRKANKREVVEYEKTSSV